MRVLPLLFVIPLVAACAGRGGYLETTIVYREPPAYVYDDGDIDGVVVVSREVLVTRGYAVYRVSRDGPNRIVWARRGDGEVVRVFLTPQGRGIAVRGVREVRSRDRRHWERHGAPDDVVHDIDARLRARRR